MNAIVVYDNTVQLTGRGKEIFHAFIHCGNTANREKQEKNDGHANGRKLFLKLYEFAFQNQNIELHTHEFPILFAAL